MAQDEDPSVTAAIVNVVCELGWRRPSDFLPLAPRLFELLVEGGNNWMAIKLIKLVSCNRSSHMENPSLRRSPVCYTDTTRTSSCAETIASFDGPHTNYASYVFAVRMYQRHHPGRYPW